MARMTPPKQEGATPPVGGHTPGPWSYGRASNYEGFYIAPAGRLPTLAAIQERDVTVFNFPQETEANARLIAAAPELLEALEALLPSKLCGENWNLADSEFVPIDITFGELRQARAAIAKARGAS